LIAGTVVPGLSQPARVLILAGLSMCSAVCLEAAWTKSLSRAARWTFLTTFAGVIGIWLVVMTYGSFVWSVTFSFYRTLGVVMGFMVLGIAILSWTVLETGNTRRGLVVMMIVAFGLKLAHWGYYVPEWNYRHSQGPWARAISQWIPRKWTLYTFHDWSPDLAFFMKRPVRQLRSPHYLPYQPGPESKYVLLQPSECENWPDSAPPISVVVKLQDEWARERILARTAGNLPPPFGPNPLAIPQERRSGLATPESKSVPSRAF
jgi:hypothetical protein